MKTARGEKHFRIIQNHTYVRTHWKNFDYSIFTSIQAKRKRGKYQKSTYNDVIVMADTETSKKKPGVIGENHIVAWSIAFRAYQTNICTLWGQDPRDFPEMLRRVRRYLPGDELIVYCHNLPYDYTFLRLFLFERFDRPTKQLNVKPYYPLYIRFGDLVFRDSLMLAQRKLEKWAQDLQVDHGKQVGKWDYERIRTQHDILTEEELDYIEGDVISGVECIDKTLIALDKTLETIPLTATGIPRKECRSIAETNRGYELFYRESPTDYIQQRFYEDVFHGGYTHNNRYYMGRVMPAWCKDFASSYPFCAIAYKYPSECFWRLDRDVGVDYILNNSEEYAFLCKLEIWGLDLRDLRFPMPSLAFSKCTETHNAIKDNGKILRADKVVTQMTEIDLQVYTQIYKQDKIIITDVLCSRKDYLPRWYTDYIYEQFRQKTVLKGVDQVLYNIAKAKLNSCAYGMAAQKPCKEDVIENYNTGEYEVQKDQDKNEIYAKKHLKNRNNFLPYHWCMYITSYAQHNLFALGACVKGVWLYSDTDSVYATEFDNVKVEQYNQKCKDILTSRGYGAVLHNGKEYWLGVAEDDGEYTEFKGLHSKCYCKRSVDGKLSITVAGVPKKGVAVLEDNIENFREGTVFPGTVTGKLQHTHFFVPKIYTDEMGNVTGDSIDLSPCDYIIKTCNMPVDLDDILYEEVTMRTYDNVL